MFDFITNLPNLPHLEARKAKGRLKSEAGDLSLHLGFGKLDPLQVWGVEVREGRWAIPCVCLLTRGLIVEKDGRHLFLLCLTSRLAPQLATKRGDHVMFEHILRQQTQTLWQWGPVAQHMIHLEGIDSAGQARRGGRE
jgi:hypothetical protein